MNPHPRPIPHGPVTGLRSTAADARQQPPPPPPAQPPPGWPPWPGRTHMPTTAVVTPVVGYRPRRQGRQPIGPAVPGSAPAGSAVPGSQQTPYPRALSSTGAGTAYPPQQYPAAVPAADPPQQQAFAAVPHGSYQQAPYQPRPTRSRTHPAGPPTQATAIHRSGSTRTAAATAAGYRIAGARLRADAAPGTGTDRRPRGRRPGGR